MNVKRQYSDHFILCCLIGLLVLPVPVVAAASISTDLLVQYGWVRLMPAVANSTAAYFSLTNTSDKDIMVVSVSSNNAESTTMHDVVINNNMSMMVPISPLLIAAGQTVVFTPGGKHLMLVNLSEKLALDKVITIYFKLKNENEVMVKMPVLRSKPLTKNTHHH